MAVESLTIERLDEISLAMFAGVPTSVSAPSAWELIPLAEWYWLKAAGHPLPELQTVRRLNTVQQALKQHGALWIDALSPRAGFIRVRRTHVDCENVAWISFLLALSRAARASGLTKLLADQLTGVVKEMEDNVHWHSGRPRSGMVAFLSHDDMFEFVVVDLGMGVLASLQSAPEFAAISDHGQALQLAVGTGNSRFGTAVGRGWGFSDLTVGVANANARIRFRSGDHLLELDGTKAAAIATRRIQRAEGKGFLVAVRVER